MIVNQPIVLALLSYVNAHYSKRSLNHYKDKVYGFCTAQTYLMVAFRVQVFFNFSILGGKGDREFRILIGTQCALAWEIVMKTGNSIEESRNLHTSYFT